MAKEQKPKVPQITSPRLDLKGQNDLPVKISTVSGKTETRIQGKTKG
jgi:hypothetical protein